MAAKRTPSQRLHLYAGIARRLERHPLITAGVGIGLELKYESGELSTTIKEPEDHLFRSLVLDLRPLLMKGDDAFLSGIFDLACSHLDDPELVHAVESARAGWDVVTASTELRLSVNGSLVTPGAAADLWLNSDYFHHDADKDAAIRALSVPATGLVRYWFIDFMIELTKVAIWTGSVIEEAERRGVIRDASVAMVVAHPHRPAESKSAR
jgi:hypothetical protein